MGYRRRHPHRRPRRQPSISGTVFQDNNGNGILDAGEPGIPGVTLFLDLNHDDTLDPGDPTAVTNASGAYSFTGLVAGSYTVREILPTGQISTQDTLSPFLSPNVAAAQASTGENFGDFPTVFGTPASSNGLHPPPLRPRPEQILETIGDQPHHHLLRRPRRPYLPHLQHRRRQ